MIGILYYEVPIILYEQMHDLVFFMNLQRFDDTWCIYGMVGKHHSPYDFFLL